MTTCTRNGATSRQGTRNINRINSPKKVSINTDIPESPDKKQIVLSKYNNTITQNTP